MQAMHYLGIWGRHRLARMPVVFRSGCGLWVHEAQAVLTQLGGSGWGGNRLARTLCKDQYDVTVISPSNHFLVTPLLLIAAAWRCLCHSHGPWPWLTMAAAKAMAMAKANPGQFSIDFLKKYWWFFSLFVDFTMAKSKIVIKKIIFYIGFFSWCL